MNSTHNFLFLSDLHLSEGQHPQTGQIHRNEDFFHDLAFAQFLAHHVRLSQDESAAEYYQTPWKLVINGDIFDFLQVVSLPPHQNGVATFDSVDEQGEPIQVEKKLSENEKRYGLGTTSAEIVWKLEQIAAGHPLFFQALGWFVAHPGNDLVFMKGNHDIEIVWPAVHKKMAQLLAESYMTWRQQLPLSGNESPLANDAELPEVLTAVSVESSLIFPESYLYEENVFFAEHGCQHDPANAFSNFADPRLPHLPEYIELPAGSLFVRYFFNDVEQVHPFADNMKPISRYIFWLLRNAPTSLFTFLLDLLPKYLKAMGQVRAKTKNHPSKNQQPAKDAFDSFLFDVQAASLHEMGQGSKQTSRRMIGSVILIVLSVIAALAGVRLLALGNYLWMVVAFIIAAVLVFWSSYLFQSLDKLLGQPFLYKAAVKICEYLNRGEITGRPPVPYFVYGHDHAADVRTIHTKNQPAYRQWYVNTGAWVPIFSENDRLLRDDEQLTFLRIVPSRLTDEARAENRDTPELLQWSSEANAPRPVRLFE